LSDFVGRDGLWLKREDVHEIGAFKWRSTLPVVAALIDRGHEAVQALAVRVEERNALRFLVELLVLDELQPGV